MARVLGSKVGRMLPARTTDGMVLLAYHRVIEADPASFPFDYGVVSASPDEFRRQMRFVRDNFDVLSFADLESLEKADKAWPKRGLMITFDDGYLDNYTNAYPILKELGLPATIFLTTGYIGKTDLFWWDLIAYCLKHTTQPSVVLDEMSASVLKLNTPSARTTAIDFVLRWVKRIPDDEKNRFLAELPARLGVDVTNRTFSRMHLSWDEVREMAASGIEFGSHTVTHPVLANVGESQLIQEVEESKREVEKQTGRRIQTFSYPVGNRGNINLTVRDAVERAGYRYAVSYVEGVAMKKGHDALAIPRVHVDADHPREMFTASLTFPRLMLREPSPYSI